MPAPNMSEEQWFSALSQEIRAFDRFYLETWQFGGKSFVKPGSGRVAAKPKVEVVNRAGKNVRVIKGP